MKTEIKNVFGKVIFTAEYDAVNRLVHQQWFGYQTRGGIVAASNAGLEIIARHRCPRLLNDNTAVLGPWDHAVDWLAQDWTPRAIAAGLTHCAHIVSPESFAALSAEALISGVAGSFELRMFSNEPTARAWLQMAR
ncbi:STAS/SEC14 domain-containing protein [Hymenobacter nivis]|uniref:STAS/SEC14 domain-containing protein n=1 Tax=Hymenobacter nivis TaxID=1850093 RepID=A0A502GJF3_9BACT|nr:STAS/SEC14 domain-containing protein [Hymenobacter nivis]TPG62417.1 STAS/SEC14 domain-containing protein [Hymenobacter nivis]